MNRAGLSAVCGALALWLACAGAALAQTYPSRPIRLVVPQSPGGSTDQVARPLALKLGEALGQPVIVENRAGAGSVIGTDIVAKAAPDGYTLIMGNAGSHGINAAVYSKLPYDILKDFAPVSQIAIAPNIFVVNPGLPVNTIPEFIAYAKARPGQLSYASGGNGSSSHMSMELLKSMAGIDVVHVPYKGSTPALTDVISGQDAVMSVNMPPAVPHVKAGKLRALAVTTRNRTPSMPDLPTVAETLPGYETVAWFGVLAPAGTPKDVINRLSTEIARIARSPEMRERLAGMGAEPVGGTPDEFGAVMARDIAKWTELAKSVGIKID
jgi:tripartite-type tricarboxylate transporter receptor subunit TctC